MPPASPAVVAAGPLLLALSTALGDEPPPCDGHTDVWTSEHRDDVAVAREGCAACPAQRQCLSYAQASDATAGVWGGRDMTRRPGRRPTYREDVPA